MPPKHVFLNMFHCERHSRQFGKCKACTAFIEIFENVYPGVDYNWDTLKMVSSKYLEWLNVQTHYDNIF